MAITHSEVDRILADASQIASLEAEFHADDVESLALSVDIEAADAACAGHPAILEIRSAFDLNASETDLLELAAAIALEPDLARVLGYMQDGTAGARASAQLAARLFGWGPSDDLPIDGALYDWHLLRRLDPDLAWTQASEVDIDSYVLAHILGRQPWDLGLGPDATLATGSEHARCLFPELLDQIEQFARAISTAPVQLELIGPDGSGKSTLAAQLAARFRCRLLIVNAGELVKPDVPPSNARDRVLRVWRAARLLNAIPYWSHTDLVDLATLSPVGLGTISLLGTEVRRKPAPGAYARRSFTLPVLTREDRTQLWAALSAEPVPAAVQDWTLNAAEVAQAAHVAPAGPTAVAESCRAVLKDASAELFTLLPTPFAWDDIVLAPQTRAHLGEFETQARLRWQVYEEWGFGRLCPLGRGVSALFAGPSGCGKTMAAQVLARFLGMDLYRVDLAGVVNKYIGETEKRLKQVFDACERTNVVLLFDEADALFGQRTQVKDAHDRFANIEIDYLLQRMEQFDGIAILATNRKGDLDKAFVRRLRFIVDFMHPGENERYKLWRIALPEHSPGGEPLLDAIDFSFLAARVVMSAAEIKLAALAAAFQARNQGGRIAMRHVLAACSRELAKQGVELRSGDLSK